MRGATNEASLVKAIRGALEREFGGFWFKVHGGAFQRIGLPDLIGCVRGKFCSLEVKLPGREHKLTLVQQSVIDLITKAGGLAQMVTTREQAIEAVARFIEED